MQCRHQATWSSGESVWAKAESLRHVDMVAKCLDCWAPKLCYHANVTSHFSSQYELIIQSAWLKTTDSKGEIRSNEGKISFKLSQFELWEMIKTYISLSILIGAWEKRANNQMTLQSFQNLGLNKLQNRTTKPKRFKSFHRSQLGFVLLIYGGPQGSLHKKGQLHIKHCTLYK